MCSEIFGRIEVDENAGVIDGDFQNLAGVMREDGAGSNITFQLHQFRKNRAGEKRGIAAFAVVRRDDDWRARASVGIAKRGVGFRAHVRLIGQGDESSVGGWIEGGDAGLQGRGEACGVIRIGDDACSLFVERAANFVGVVAEDDDDFGDLGGSNRLEDRGEQRRFIQAKKLFRLAHARGGASG